MTADHPATGPEPRRYRTLRGGVLGWTREPERATGEDAAPRTGRRTAPVDDFDALDRALLMTYGVPQGINAHAIIRYLAQDGWIVARAAQGAAARMEADMGEDAAPRTEAGRDLLFMLRTHDPDDLNMEARVRAIEAEAAQGAAAPQPEWCSATSDHHEQGFCDCSPRAAAQPDRGPRYPEPTDAETARAARWFGEHGFAVVKDEWLDATVRAAQGAAAPPDNIVTRPSVHPEQDDRAAPPDAERLRDALVELHRYGKTQPHGDDCDPTNCYVESVLARLSGASTDSWTAPAEVTYEPTPIPEHSWPHPYKCAVKDCPGYALGASTDSTEERG